jgi:hypothetical protein
VESAFVIAMGTAQIRNSRKGCFRVVDFVRYQSDLDLRRQIIFDYQSNRPVLWDIQAQPAVESNTRERPTRHG